jgi:redox-sensitive bicupin YhaK (pirin superfamily)
MQLPATIDVRPYRALDGYDAPGIAVRDHFRASAERHGTPRFRLGPLVVLADTAIAAHAGFPRHFHREMEIVTYVCEGALTHMDDLGNRGDLARGEAQVMTCGTGINHAEANAGDEPTRVYQLWLEPALRGLAPAYVDVHDTAAARAGRLAVIASGRPHLPGLAAIRQDAAVLAATLKPGEAVEHRLDPGRRAYVLAAHGRLAVNGALLAMRDGAVVEGVPAIRIEARDPGDALIIDLP